MEEEREGKKRRSRSEKKKKKRGRTIRGRKKRKGERRGTEEETMGRLTARKMCYRMLGEKARSVSVERVWWWVYGRPLGRWAYLMLLLMLHSHPPHTAAQYTDTMNDSRLPRAHRTWVGVENNTMVNVKAQLGYKAFLPCSVRMIGDKQISWIRRRDWHVLTSGVFTYTTDERFSITHRDGADDWTLSIKFLQARDNGTYECQISTGTGIVSQFVNLNVIVPEAFILGNSEYHVETGSPINLFCIIEQTHIPPHVVYWKHNGRLLNYDSERGGVSVTTEHGTKTSSRLATRQQRSSEEHQGVWARCGCMGGRGWASSPFSHCSGGHPQPTYSYSATNTHYFSL
ncbi:Zwei Ig domain protein zig-8-like 7 [Homarus americanus]|uniref:Zwei Ig domain protein zig-8-like 7 n=1 Tax=Homarus americanus TaxID=6706 RepID=A0A8J5K3H3_HOMAM|nr:Zwei Ig domain protein zig-8-like 7 [Homarus americanus]